MGKKCLKPEFRHQGKVVQPIRPTQPTVERYTMDLHVVKNILHKIFDELKVIPENHKVIIVLKI